MKIPTFLKWAGGKRRLIDQLDRHVPKKIETYYETFLGGGAMFFYIKQKYMPKRTIISDINKDLIDTFIAVRDHPIDIIKYLEYLKKNNCKNFYYKLRADYNRNLFTGIKRCAAFIYLNKTCFNGLYRVNKKNEFNVPYGNYSNPEIYNTETILLASKILKGTIILHRDYFQLLSNIKQGDFLYLDPCYDPIKKTSFTNYTPLRFTEEDNNKLAYFIASASTKGAKVLLSNNVTKGVKKRYPKNQGFKQIIVYCPRFINSDGKNRGNIPELLIKNY